MPGNYGPRGEDGSPGINGIDGLPGLPGIKGSRGDPGSAILFGELGIDGDEGNLNEIICIYVVNSQISFKVTLVKRVTVVILVSLD